MADSSRDTANSNEIVAGDAHDKPWHGRDASEVLEAFETSERGLDAETARQRLGQYRKNMLTL